MENTKNKNIPFEMSELLKPYHFIVENGHSEPKQVVLFGAHYYLSSVNYGSDIGVWVNSADKSATTLQLLQQSVIEFKPKGIRIITDSWDKMPKSMFYKDVVTGERLNISLVDSETWGIKFVNGKAVNDIPFGAVIHDKTKMTMTMEAFSKIELLIY